MEEIRFIELLAGIGIFLFGMFQLEESLKQLSGGTFRKLIRKFTKNWLRSVTSGVLATAILQSSSAVSLMVLAFAGAGIIGMESAIGVIIGSNLGTTLTSWIVATVGFKLKIEILALPFIGLGGLGLIFFGTSTRATNISKFMVGFGFLFLGLDYMKSSIEALAQDYDLAALKNYPGIAFLAIGFVLTAIVQSSSASMAIILSALHTGVLTFPLAAFMVIGTNLGTTVTVMIGSLGPQSIKKRVAFSHLLFNSITAGIALLIFPLLVYIIQDIFHLSNDPVTGLALFHTLFNLLGVLVFLPFIGYFTSIVIRVIKEKENNVTHYIHSLKPDVPEAGIAALQNEIRHLILEVIRYHIRILKFNRREPFQSFFKKEETTKTINLNLPDHYLLIKSLEAEIYAFASGVQVNPLKDEEARELNKQLHSARNAVASAKTIKDIQHNILEAENTDNDNVSNLLLHVKDHWLQAHEIFLKVLEAQDSGTNISNLQALENLTKEEDLSFTHLITQAIASRKIKQGEIPTMITLNRVFVLSVRQLINALRDLQLTEPEAVIAEKLSEASS